MTHRIVASLVIALISASQTISAFNAKYSFADPDDPQHSLNCPEVYFNQTLDQLNDDCRILRVYNETQIQLMDQQQADDLALNCACQLFAMRHLWSSTFDDDPNAFNLYEIVVGAEKARDTSVLLWTNVEIFMEKVSIYTVTKDAMKKRAKGLIRMPYEIENHKVFRYIKKVCQKVADDPMKLYRYLENLNRVSPKAVLRLIYSCEPVNLIFQASRACKNLIQGDITDYQLRPPNPSYVVVDPPVDFYAIQTPGPEFNKTAYDEKLDEKLRHASTMLTRCQQWQKTRKSFQELKQSCPMMFNETVPVDWIEQHSTYLDRSQTALECGCQLLLHNRTWTHLVEDPNVQLLTRALVNYLNDRSMPDLVNSPLWSIHDWLHSTLATFLRNRKNTIREFIKAMTNSVDPLFAINERELIYEEALEKIRRGCNYIVYNHNKERKENQELKIIKYLGNLRQITQDPLFVFSLVLQNQDLFKLYALAKVCHPFVN